MKFKKPGPICKDTDRYSMTDCEKTGKVKTMLRYDGVILKPDKGQVPPRLKRKENRYVD